MKITTLTPEMVQEAWVMAAHAFINECAEDNKQYEPLVNPEFWKGFDLDTVLNFKVYKATTPTNLFNTRVKDDLVLYILSTLGEVDHLTKCFIKAHRAGHRDFLWISLLGYVHRSQLPQLYRMCKEYFESL